jgi:hypothetical protein
MNLATKIMPLETIIYFYSSISANDRRVEVYDGIDGSTR